MNHLQETNRRFYKIGGITIQVSADLPITDSTFHPKFKRFETQGRGRDTIYIHHHFHLPDMGEMALGKKVYHRSPWAIYKTDDQWIYLDGAPSADLKNFNHAAIFDRRHGMGKIYNKSEEGFLRGRLDSLSLSPTDQIFLGRVLAYRQGCILHSAGVILKEKGLLFVGQSDAGKSTITDMLRENVEILCDDRIIARRQPDGFQIHGTWAHGDIPEISPNSAPMNGLFFLEQSSENRLIPMNDRNESIRRLLACLIKPLQTSDWWERMLSLLEMMAREAPIYTLRFDKSGKVNDLLEKFIRLRNGSPA